MTEVRTRGIAVKNLDEKQLGCGHRIKRALPPPIGDTTTGSQDGVGLELICPLLLKLWLNMRSGELREQELKQGSQQCFPSSSHVMHKLKEAQIQG